MEGKGPGNGGTARGQAEMRRCGPFAFLVVCLLPFTIEGCSGQVLSGLEAGIRCQGQCLDLRRRDERLPPLEKSVLSKSI